MHRRPSPKRRPITSAGPIGDTRWRASASCRRRRFKASANRAKAQAVGVSVDQIISGGCLGSSYVNQFTQFGRTFQAGVQADAIPPSRRRSREHCGA